MKKLISYKTNHPIDSISLYPHPTYKKILDAYDKIKYDKMKSSFVSNLNNISDIYALYTTFSKNFLNYQLDKINLSNYIFSQSNKAFKFYISELIEIE